MKVFFDMEFTGLKQSTQPISIGAVTSYGGEFYGEFTDFDSSNVDDWVKKNVLNNLIYSDNSMPAYGYNHYRGPKELIYKKFIQWTKMLADKSPKDQLVFWSDCLSYDWVLLNEFWGGALNMPDWINYIPRDLCTLLEMKNVDPDINREEFAEIKHINAPKHLAIWDAKVIKACYYKCIKLKVLRLPMSDSSIFQVKETVR